MARTLSLHPSTRDSSPASSERNPFDQDGNGAENTTCYSSDASHYSEADEKRLHESDGHYWAHRRLSTSHQNSPAIDIPTRHQALSLLRLNTSLNHTRFHFACRGDRLSSRLAPSRTIEGRTQILISLETAPTYLPLMSLPLP